MRPVFVPCLLLLMLMLTAPATFAQVLAGWGDSPTNGASGSLEFDCQSNGGASAVIVSFVPPKDIAGVTGFSADLWVALYTSDTVGLALPAYWDLGAGGCRARALSMAPGFQGLPLVDPSPVVDPWQAALQFTVLRPWTEGSPGFAHCGVGGLLEPGSRVDLLAGHEYYMGTFTLSHAGSASTGACAGCCVGMRFQPTIEVSAGGSTVVYAGASSALWNPDFHGSCSYTTPTRTSTWGALKSAYR